MYSYSYKKNEIDKLFDINSDISKRKSVSISDRSLNKIIENYNNTEEARLELNGIFSAQLKGLFLNETDMILSEKYLEDIFSIDGNDVFHAIIKKIRKGIVVKQTVHLSKKYFQYLLNHDGKFHNEAFMIRYIMNIIKSNGDVGKDYIFFLIDFFQHHRDAKDVNHFTWRFARSYDDDEFQFLGNKMYYWTQTRTDDDNWYIVKKILLKSRYGKDLYKRYFKNEITGYNKFRYENGKLYLKSGKKLTKKDVRDFSFLLLDYEVFDEQIVNDIMSDADNAIFWKLTNELNSDNKTKAGTTWERYLSINNSELIPDYMYEIGWNYTPDMILKMKKSMLVPDEKVLEYLKEHHTKRSLVKVIENYEEYLSEGLTLLLKLNDGVLDED